MAISALSLSADRLRRCRPHERLRLRCGWARRLCPQSDHARLCSRRICVAAFRARREPEWRTFRFEEDRDGYVLGVGMETVISGGWTLKAEYRYTYFGDDTVLIFPFIGDFGRLERRAVEYTPSPSARTIASAPRTAAPALETPAYNWTGFYVGGALGAGAVVHDIGIVRWTLQLRRPRRRRHLRRTQRWL